MSAPTFGEQAQQKNAAVPNPEYPAAGGIIPTSDPANQFGEPEHGSPAWHLAEAEEYAARADEAVADGRLDIVTAHLLAATANAQIGALKLAFRQDAMLAEMRETLLGLGFAADNISRESGATRVTLEAIHRDHFPRS
jgi:hypothetical protein